MIFFFEMCKNGSFLAASSVLRHTRRWLGGALLTANCRLTITSAAYKISVFFGNDPLTASCACFACFPHLPLRLASRSHLRPSPGPNWAHVFADCKSKSSAISSHTFFVPKKIYHSNYFQLYNIPPLTSLPRLIHSIFLSASVPE